MALSNIERQARYRQRMKAGELTRIDAKLPPDIAGKLEWLAAHWGCSKTEALGRALTEAWQQAGEPVPAGKPVPDNEQSAVSPQEPAEGHDEVAPVLPSLEPPQAPAQPAEAKKRTPGPQTIARWQKEAEERVINGLSAIREHLNRNNSDRYGEMSYAGIRSLLGDTDYRIACRVEIRRLQEQGLKGAAIAKKLNEQGIPLPTATGRGRWTGPKVKAVMKGVSSRNGKNRTLRRFRCLVEAYPNLASGDATQKRQNRVCFRFD